MKQCFAYRASRIHRSAWERCAQPRGKGLRFCRAHARTLEGLLLGLLAHGYPKGPHDRDTRARRVH